LALLFVPRLWVHVPRQDARLPRVSRDNRRYLGAIGPGRLLRLDAPFGCHSVKNGLGCANAAVRFGAAPVKHDIAQDLHCLDGERLCGWQGL
jgi:hypothetical protein